MTERKPSRWSGVIQGFNDALLVFWVCRVSAFSVAFGIVLFGLVPQARDLFLDAPSAGAWWGGVPAMAFRAVCFALALLIFWAGPVFFAARNAVDDEHWTARYFPASGTPVAEEALKARFAGFVEWIPFILGSLCFVAVLLALALVFGDLYDGDNLTAVSSAKWQIGAHAIAVAISAAAFLLVALGRAKIHDATLGNIGGEKLGAWRPRPAEHDGKITRLGIMSIALGLLLTAAVVGLVLLPQATLGLERATLFVFVLGAWIPAITWTSCRSYRVKLPIILIGFLVLIILPALLGDHTRIRLLPVANNATQRSGPGVGTQWLLHTAVEQWAKANECDVRHRPATAGQEVIATSIPRSADNPRECPSPVIVAAAGGASRAAFITAATLGTLLDATCTKLPADGALGCSESPLFARRLFAISGVSGGSLGASVYAAALAAAREKGSPFAPPCDRDREEIRELYFKHVPPRTWRDCLAAMASGDFLSATALGVALRDPIPLVRRLYDLDRAASLEEAFGDWFDIVTANKGPSYFKRAFGSFGPRAGDWRPLLVFNGTSAITGRRVLTSHVTANHSVEVNDEQKQFRIFQDAYDIRELYKRPFTDDPQRCSRIGSDDAPENPINAFGSRDFSLATAVTNSARFPVISPAGAIACVRSDVGIVARIWGFFTGGDRELVDHIVDGGYFENFGATTAMNLARALETFGLKPVVLVISNNPMAGQAAENLLADACAPLSPEIADDTWLGQIFRPAGALYQTRDARGSYAVRDLVWSLRTPQARGVGCKAAQESEPAFHVTVFGERGPSGQAKSVSMSWWLSKAVQQFIDFQIPDNRDNPDASPDVIEGRLYNVRSMVNLCDRIGAGTECRNFFVQLPLTKAAQAEYLAAVRNRLAK